ncbi:MAG: hypothetical protein RLZZ232_3737 [Planctomycetota bacterium]
MEAQTWRFSTCVVLSWIAACSCTFAAERFETANFIVVAENADVARQVGLAAEHQRKTLAIYWLKKAMPNWSKPCRVSVNVGSMGAGGQTTFQFINGEVVNWRMSVQGSLERILDSVLPHEVNHTIFASHFRRPLPRWADEGAATLFEHNSEQRKQLHLLHQVIQRKEDYFALQELLSMKEYPQDATRMLTLYAQGFTLADFLVQQRGQYTWLQFLEDGEDVGWEDAIRKHYDHEGVRNLERNWRGWILAGMPKLKLPESSTPETLLVAAEATRDSTVPTATNKRKSPAAPAGNSVIRSQSPDGADQTATAITAAPNQAQTKSSPSPIPRSESVAMTEKTAAASSAKTGAVAAPPVFRHQSLQAPRPNHKSPNTSGQPSGTQPPATLTVPPADTTKSKSNPADDTWFEDTRPATMSPSNSRKNPRADARRPRNSPSSAAADQFVPTGLSTINAAQTTLRTAEPTPLPANLPANLPGERKGGTRPPQWAGFPGQVKLF